jgi:hypothetical protein
MFIPLPVYSRSAGPLLRAAGQQHYMLINAVPDHIPLRLLPGAAEGRAAISLYAREVLL